LDWPEKPQKLHMRTALGTKVRAQRRLFTAFSAVLELLLPSSHSVTASQRRIGLDYRCHRVVPYTFASNQNSKTDAFKKNQKPTQTSTWISSASRSVVGLTWEGKLRRLCPGIVGTPVVAASAAASAAVVANTGVG